MAVDQNDNEVARVTAAGTPKTFTITVPVGSNFRLYFIENEGTISQNIFPFYQGATNNFYISSSIIVDLGFVDTKTGLARPVNNPLWVSGVSSAGEIIGIPTYLVNPILPAGASLTSLIATGLLALSQGDLLKAKAYFKAAVENYPSDSSNNGDTARFFYALTRVTGFDLYSDGNSQNLDSVGDLFDRANCTYGGRSLLSLATVCPETLPADFPTGSEIQTSLNNVIKPELEGAIANLNAVSSSFIKAWTEPNSLVSYTSDYGDVLFLKAALEAAVAGILVQSAYNMNANIGAASIDKNILPTFLNNNAAFLTLADSTPLSAARTYLSQTADDLTAAIDKVAGHSSAYLITLQGKTPQEIADAKADIANWKASLYAATTVDKGNDGILGTADDVIVNMTPFFSGLSIRALLPPFTGNKPGFFPDATMGGVVVQGGNLNRDINHNGIPDILE